MSNLPYQNYGSPSGQSNFGGAVGIKSGVNIFGGASDQSNPFGSNPAQAQGAGGAAMAVGNATAALTGVGDALATTTTGATPATTPPPPATDTLAAALPSNDYFGNQIANMPGHAQTAWTDYQQNHPLTNSPMALRDQQTGFITSYDTGQLNAMTPAQAASEQSIPHDANAYVQYWMNKISTENLGAMPLGMNFGTEIPMMNSDQLLAYAGLPSNISLGTAQSQVISPYYSSSSFLNRQNPAPTGGSIGGG
jgi:hypothetical protein